MIKPLKQKYKEEVEPALKEELGLKNSIMVPRITKVVLNVGLSNGLKDDKFVQTVEETLKKITGQKPIATRARQSIAGFKIREEMVVGMKVTLRKDRMYAFIDKLIHVSLPRIRDFRGLNPKSVDKQGNLSIGFRENLSFPEINPDAVDRLHGLQVTVTTTAKNYQEGQLLLTKLGFPFKKN